MRSSIRYALYSTHGSSDVLQGARREWCEPLITFWLTIRALCYIRRKYKILQAEHQYRKINNMHPHTETSCPSLLPNGTQKRIQRCETLVNRPRHTTVWHTEKQPFCVLAGLLLYLERKEQLVGSCSVLCPTMKVNRLNDHQLLMKTKKSMDPNPEFMKRSHLPKIFTETVQKQPRCISKNINKQPRKIH
jgi:hypothetical protein